MKKRKECCTYADFLIYLHVGDSTKGDAQKIYELVGLSNEKDLNTYLTRKSIISNSDICAWRINCKQYGFQTELLYDVPGIGRDNVISKAKFIKSLKNRWGITHYITYPQNDPTQWRIITYSFFDISGEHNPYKSHIHFIAYYFNFNNNNAGLAGCKNNMKLMREYFKTKLKKACVDKRKDKMRGYNGVKLLAELHLPETIRVGNDQNPRPKR